jgi:hypothetical protein
MWVVEIKVILLRRCRGRALLLKLMIVFVVMWGIVIITIKVMGHASINQLLTQLYKN